MKRPLTILITALFVYLPGVSLAGHSSNIRLTVDAPKASNSIVRSRHGIRTIRYRNRVGIMSTTQWPLVLRMESRTSVAVLDKKANNQRRGAVVLADPDDCLNVHSLIEDFSPSGFDFTCVIEDETYIEVLAEQFDSFKLEEENLTTGNDLIRLELTDDAFASGELLDTAYLRMSDGKIKPVGPKTGDDLLDGYGYGTDDDLASLVIMVDMGAARVFDEDFNHVPGVIRNMGGFINTVSIALLDGKKNTAVVASAHPLAGVFEPIALFDFSVTHPDFAGPNVDYLHQVDSGPIVPFDLVSDFPPDPPDLSMPDNDFYDELLATYYPQSFKLRAVLVHGEAPAFITDEDGNGKYTAYDVSLMEGGKYQLVSNEVEVEINIIHDNLLSDSADAKCPPRTLLYRDLDGDGSDGAPPNCSGTSGSSKSRRPPR